MKESQTKIFESDNIWASIFKMVVPALIAILVMLIYNMADMIFVGQTGDTAQVAAVSVVSPVFSLIMAVAMLISGGGIVIIARDLGAKDLEHARMSASLCMWAAVVLGILSGVFVVLFQKPLLSFLGTTSDMEAFARTYMIILACGAPFLMISNMLGQVLRAEGAVKEGLIGNLLGTILNIILDPIFILYFHMGVTGAAVATVIGNFAATIYYFHYMVKKSQILNMDMRYVKKEPLYIFSIMALGLPTAVSTMLSGFAGSIGNQLLSKYGSDAIAANAAAGRVNLIIIMVLMGICMGAQPLMSYNYGAGNMKKLSGVMKRLFLLSSLVGLGVTVVVILLRGPVIGLFLQEAEVAKMAERVLTIIMFSSPFIGIFYLSTNFLQATGEAMKATVLSALQKGVILIPMLYVMEYFFGLMGIRYAYVMADFSAIIIGGILLIVSWKKCTEKFKNNSKEDNCISITMDDRKRKKAI